MNWYRFHIGDFYRDAHGLTPAEHGIYRMLIDAYYLHESPIEDDAKCIKRVSNCRTISERHATARVLERFFELKDGFWHHARIDRDLAGYAEKAPAREFKREDAKERKARHHQRRRILFDALRAASAPVRWNAPVRELRELAQRLGLTEALRRDSELERTRNTVLSGTTDAHRTHVLGEQIPAINGYARSPANISKGTDGQKTGDAERDIPSTHYPLTNRTHSVLGDASEVAEAPANGAPQPVCVPVESEPGNRTAEAIAAAAGAIGIAYGNPRDALLLALVQRGAVLGDFETAATEAVARGKGWAYMLGIVRTRLDDSTRNAERAREGPKSGREGVKTVSVDEAIAAGRELAARAAAMGTKP